MELITGIEGGGRGPRHTRLFGYSYAIMCFWRFFSRNLNIFNNPAKVRTFVQVLRGTIFSGILNIKHISAKIVFFAIMVMEYIIFLVLFLFARIGCNHSKRRQMGKMPKTDDFGFSASRSGKHGNFSSQQKLCILFLASRYYIQHNTEQIWAVTLNFFGCNSLKRADPKEIRHIESPRIWGWKYINRVWTPRQSGITRVLGARLHPL